ncbi:hypothetical protein Q31b_55480 [Novipirellula aureliae]|uniref:3-keto-alpha-glucoside-1,2-lyase/3-keto-2-hydroxy-glucal hydratase domain-containing protein n=1 Tax=Novipirellula aureliae TaxID=2527966 RepID=A0A5C6DBM9_9BACT|nr:DUF1080 domain-containing protein [Novipirellula aureliae]TWU34593.1 hypothetical protein Q31b_55480 [Novipirellula aureliae]
MKYAIVLVFVLSLLPTAFAGEPGLPFGWLMTRQISMSLLVSSADTNEATEPSVNGPGVIDLLESGTLDAWKVPSDRWHLEEKSIIVGSTGTEKLDLPEWLYTKQSFGDFEFTCELKLTGDNRRNTGIYFRANPFTFKGYKTFEAPSGYEFDAGNAAPNKKNMWGSVGDWYARPSLRIFADQTVIVEAFKPEDWNRVTIRARENRLEYWINGTKIMDYRDNDPKGSRDGLIGFQIHDRSVMKVAFRNIRVLPLSQPKKQGPKE